MGDVNGIPTTDATAAKTYTYSVTLLKQISGYSINSISASKTNSTATISIIPPLKGVKSSAPINGSYQISCTDPSGRQWSTPDIAFNTNHNWI